MVIKAERNFINQGNRWQVLKQGHLMELNKSGQQLTVKAGPNE